MDELNLAERFGGQTDERMPVFRKKKRKTIPGTGMEKPKVRFEDEDEGAPEEAGFGDLGLEEEEGEEPEAGEENPFRDLIEQMRGGSASAGRAKKKRAKLPPMPKRGEEEEE